ncbi:MAG: PocR ligand-binding domain-containing protein [Candidatus Omnitrophica bacterium]|nr:PocR ligand-binding domain-containing protein [Candidatus Omnitrophota bacterium]
MNLFDIIEKEKWQKMQNGFSKALGICIRTVDLEGAPFPSINTPSQFCLNIAQDMPKDARTWHESCIPRVIRRVREDKSDNFIVGPFGEYLYGIPIEIKEEGTLAYVIVGPVLLQKQKRVEEYVKIAADNKIAADSLLNNIANLKRFTFNNIESTVQLLHEVAHYIMQLNYDTKKLKDKFIGASRALDSLVKDIYSSACFDELLNALLDISLHTTKGDTGSIMLLDQDKNELAVRFSRGLKDEFVKKARVEVGKGISGLVAKDKKPLLLDSSVKDTKIKNRLKRPYIKSSIIYPLEIKNRLFGVLNLNNTEGKKRFDSETLDLIGNLTRLTKIALGQFPEKYTFTT